MPAHDAPRAASQDGHAVPSWPPRALAGALAIALLLAVGPGSAAPTEGRNWSDRIAAVRSSQLYHEASMRAADQHLRSLKHARRLAQRKLARAGRRLERAVRQRGELRDRQRSLVGRLAVARAWNGESLAGAGVEAQWPPIALLPASKRVIRPWGTGQPGRGSPVSDPIPWVPSGSARPEWAPARGSVTTSASLLPSDPAVPLASPVGAALEIAVLAQEAERHKGILGKAGRKVRRVQRSHRAKARAMASIRQSKRVTISVRESAEASLASAILAMSDLAQRRVAKKTRVRPGRGDQFAWPAQGRISQSYGCTGFGLNPARGWCAHFHDGIDIAGYLGTPVRATAVGVISYVGWNPWDEGRRAFLVVVAHPGGYETLYGHVLPARQVRVGQLVRRGEVIAYMGSTGHSTGPHLHLEFRRGRTTLNPLAFL